MAEMIYQNQRVVVAADASARATFAPPNATSKWRVDSVTLLPNETSAANDTNYATVTPKRGSTALATGRSTTTAGGALTQNEPVNFTLTGTPSEREITQTAPLHVLVDATPGSGVAVDVSILVGFTELRS